MVLNRQLRKKCNYKEWYHNGQLWKQGKKKDYINHVFMIDN